MTETDDSASRDAERAELDAWLTPALPATRVFPVLHDRLDLGVLVRSVLELLDPAAVAVELPRTLRKQILQAVERLPKLSLVISELPGEPALVWSAAPGDPFVVALRWALETKRPCFFIDPDVPYPVRYRDAVPDPYALIRLGPKAYFGAIVEVLDAAASQTETRPEDELREAGMAHYIHQARKELSSTDELLTLVGAAHFSRLLTRLKRPTTVPLARTHRSHCELRHIHPSSLTALLPDPPVAHAAFELLRNLGDGATEEPDSLSEDEQSDASVLESTTARKVSLMKHGLQLITGDAPEEDRIRPMRRARYVSRACARTVAGIGRYPDRQALQGAVWKIAVASHRRQTQEQIAPWQSRLFFDFSRRYARIQGLLVPNLYEWTVAARGVADDNLAWEVFDVARTYPWQEETAEIPTVRVDGDELDLGTRKIRFRKRHFKVKKRFVPVRERPTPKDPSEWLEGFDGSGICSHRPEDIVIEDYARFLQKKAISILSTEQTRSEPFTTSMLDGLDMRATLRNLHEDKIYVRELGRAPGDAGSVVVIFDRDLTNQEYRYCMTWLGEHEQESDMAFFSTEPTEHIVGPGIMRATYGGFMMTYPPQRLYDVWQDSDYRDADEKAEVLLMAGVDYSQEKLVVHLAAVAPSEKMRRYAARHGKRIVHIPLGSMSPATLRRIRVMHVLAGHDKRAIAKDYVW